MLRLDLLSVLDTKYYNKHPEKNTRKLWEVMDIFITWDVGMVSPVYADAQTH